MEAPTSDREIVMVVSYDEARILSGCGWVQFVSTPMILETGCSRNQGGWCENVGRHIILRPGSGRRWNNPRVGLAPSPRRASFTLPCIHHDQVTCACVLAREDRSCDYWRETTEAKLKYTQIAREKIMEVATGLLSQSLTPKTKLEHNTRTPTNDKVPKT